MGINSCTLVRHFESEGNLYNNLFRLDELDWGHPDFERLHHSEWRLTKRGVRQGAPTWEWIDNNREKYNQPIPFIF